MQVKIEDETIGLVATITITNIKGTNNFGYAFEEDGTIWAGGTIFNHDGDIYDLIERVLNGRSVLRKD